MRRCKRRELLRRAAVAAGAEHRRALPRDSAERRGRGEQCVLVLVAVPVLVLSLVPVLAPAPVLSLVPVLVPVPPPLAA